MTPPMTLSCSGSERLVNSFQSLDGAILPNELSTLSRQLEGTAASAGFERHFSHLSSMDDSCGMRTSLEDPIEESLLISISTSSPFDHAFSLSDALLKRHHEILHFAPGPLCSHPSNARMNKNGSVAIWLFNNHNPSRSRA